MDAQLADLRAAPNGHGHRTLAEKAFETLHQAIMTGRLSPGVRLPIEDLAAALQMSPMPIREALRRLDAEGLVENVPHKGARVTTLTVEDLAEVYDARIALETLAIRRAAENFTAADETRCRTLAAAAELSDDEPADAYSAAHHALHFALYEAAGSSWLERLIRPVWESSERYWLVLPSRRQPAGRLHEHGEIIDACAAHDPDLAAARIRQHLTDTAHYIAARMGGTLPLDLAATDPRRVGTLSAPGTPA